MTELYNYSQTWFLLHGGNLQQLFPEARHRSAKIASSCTSYSPPSQFPVLTYGQPTIRSFQGGKILLAWTIKIFHQNWVRFGRAFSIDGVKDRFLWRHHEGTLRFLDSTQDDALATLSDPTNNGINLRSAMSTSLDSTHVRLICTVDLISIMTRKQRRQQNYVVAKMACRKIVANLTI